MSHNTLLPGIASPFKGNPLAAQVPAYDTAILGSNRHLRQDMATALLGTTHSRICKQRSQVLLDLAGTRVSTTMLSILHYF